MSLKIVLTSLPFFNHVYTPPIQLAYLKAYLKIDKDIEVKVIDFEPDYFRSPRINGNAALYWHKIWYRDNNFREKDRPLLDEFVCKILAEEPAIVGFSVARSNASFTQYVSKEIKRIMPGIYVIYGGRHYCMRERYRDLVAQWHQDLPQVDCIVKNEGEESLKEIVETLKKGIKPTFCKGTTLRFGDKIIDGGDRMLIDDINSIPFPDLSDFPKNNYLGDYVRMLFSRGCIGQCAYCVENDTMGKKVRYRSADNVVGEIKLRLSKGYRRFQLCDLALNSSIQPLLEICKRITDQKLDIEFTFSEFRNARHLTSEVFGILYKAGFRTVCFGTESGSQRILDRMGKGVQVQTIENNLKDAHDQGLAVILFLMVGFPGETEETFLETVDMLRRNKHYIDGIAAIASTEICGGSKINENIEKYGINATTVFHDPDTWESLDGINNLPWRKNLLERMRDYFKDFEIPLVDFSIDGNPMIPTHSNNMLSSEWVKKYSDNILHEVVLDKSGLKLQYTAELKMHEKYIDNEANNNRIFVIEVTNSADRVWQRADNDWIRVGCKVYDAEHVSEAPLMELRQDLPKDIEKGEKFQVAFRIMSGVLPIGKYCIKFDMVNELQFWFADLGSVPLVEYLELKVENIATHELKLKTPDKF